MATQITAAKISAAMRRLERYVATKPFQAAVADLRKDPSRIASARRNPKAYLAGFGVVLPDDCSAELRVTKPTAAAVAKAATTFAAEVHFCISFCTEEACYTVCVRFRIPFLGTRAVR
jgi:hypothetical protein